MAKVHHAFGYYESIVLLGGMVVNILAVLVLEIF